MDIYQETIEKVQYLLKENTEWKERYRGYIDEINSSAPLFEKARRQFRPLVAFQLYMPLSMATRNRDLKNEPQNTYFDLRFRGQSVATIIVNNYKNKTVTLRIKETNAIYETLSSAGMVKEEKYLRELFKGSESKSEYDWHSTEAKNFRKIYTELDAELKANNNIYLSGQPEHGMEDALLKNFSKKSSNGKEISYIRPVTMLEKHIYFQMPTPIAASSIVKGIDNLGYSNEYGGGIDILARMGIGSGTKLAALELKYKNQSSEPPEKAICQAIAYATFLRELLRCDCGQDWWRFFGFGGNIPNALDIKAVIVMPNEPGACTAFGGKELPLRDSRDKISLEYFYRANEEKGLQQKTSIEIN